MVVDSSILLIVFNINGYYRDVIILSRIVAIFHHLMKDSLFSFHLLKRNIALFLFYFPFVKSYMVEMYIG